MKTLTDQQLTNANKEFDVVIVGYGPAGAVSAILLGQSGLNVLVIEKEQDVYPLPRAIALDNEVMRILQSLGVTDQLLKDFVTSRRYEFVDKDRKLLFGINRQPDHETDYWAETFLFRQPELERLLRAQVEKFPNVQVHTSETFIELIQHESHVELHTDKTVYAAKFVLGCDGAKSAVRIACQIQMNELETYNQPWLVVDTILKDGEHLPESMQQICDAYRPTTYIPRAGTQERRWEFQLRPGETAEDIQKTETIYDLIAPWISKDKIEIERSAVYTFRALEATSWRKGRVFFLGDAAHMMPPFLGQGLCSGVRDAQNICWKLSGVIKETMDDSILESYELERKEHVRYITYLAVLLGKIIMLESQTQKRKRLLSFVNRLPVLGKKVRNLSIKLPSIQDTISTKALGNRYSGQRIRQSKVLYHNQPMLIDELIENRFAVVAFNLNPTQLVDNAILQKWKRFGAIFIQIVPNGARVEASNDVVIVEDLEGKLESFYKNKGATCLMIRPDKYILGEVYKRGDFVHKITQVLEKGQRYPSSEKISVPNLLTVAKYMIH